jgi:hypothetical protein
MGSLPVNLEMIQTETACSNWKGIPMSRTAVGVVSFVAGFLCSMLLWGGAHSTTSNGITVEAAVQNLDPPSAFWGEELAAAIPRVPPLPTSVVSGGKVINAPQSLDGLNCRRCSFVNSELIYAGGPFQLADITVSGTTHLKLQGAAANTLALLAFFSGIEAGVPVAPSVPQQPISRTSTAKKPMTKLDFSPPFIGQR